MLIMPEWQAAREEAWGTDEGSWTRVCLSHAGELAALLDGIERVMAEKGYSPRACFEFRLVMEEAVVNGLKHGNGGDPSKQVRVLYRVLTESVLADVEDEGPGFDPSAVPDPTAPENLERPCGRGLLLMRHYTTWMRYYGRGNRLSLCKYRPYR